MDYSYVIYDGDCGFCNKIVMLIAKNDKKDEFRFVSSLSDFGQETLYKFEIKGLEKSTIILVEKKSFFTKSKAVKKIVQKIPKYYFLSIFLSIFPNIISDYCYDFISKRRTLLIKNKTCELPSQEISNKFIS